MQFDVIIGNPPYQLDDGGYGDERCADLPPVRRAGDRRSSRATCRMVIPSRWLAGGQGAGRVPRANAHRRSHARNR